MLLFLAQEHGHAAGDYSQYYLPIGATIFVYAIVVITVLMAQGGLGVVPKGWGAVYEHIFDWLDGLSTDLMGPEGRKYTPFAMSIFLFVLVSNWSGLLPWPEISGALEGHGGEGGHAGGFHYAAPSTSFNTTLALALISFGAFNVFGLMKRIFPPKDDHHKHGKLEEVEPEVPGHPVPHHHNPGGLAGLGVWIAHFWQPTPQLWASMDGAMRWMLVPILGVLFIVLNIVEELARIMSLSIRLYGNIFGESSVHHNLMGTMWTFFQTSLSSLAVGNLGGGIGMGVMVVVLWGASLFATCLGGLAGFIQAMIFSVLTLSYIGHAVADEH